MRRVFVVMVCVFSLSLTATSCGMDAPAQGEDPNQAEAAPSSAVEAEHTLPPAIVEEATSVIADAVTLAPGTANTDDGTSPAAPEPAPAESATKPAAPTAAIVSRCNNAMYVADVTIPDGTVIKPGERFLKKWRLRNTGDCQWTTSYSLVFGYGNPMGGTAANIDHAVKPGETVEIAVWMTAPMEEGWHAGWWRMKSESGDHFGEFVFVSIQVAKS